MFRTVGIMMMCASVGAMHAQAPAEPSGFDVATIKLSRDQQPGMSGINTGNGRLSAQNVTLMRCIIGAYGIGPHQVLGGPDWINTTRFDIEARTLTRIDDDDALNALFQQLLADRFALKLHREKKTMKAYSLEVAKEGVKIQPTGDGESTTSGNSTNTTKTLDAGHVSMDRLAKVLERETPIPVVNNTGLNGFYSFKLRWTPDNARSPESKTEDYGSLPDALHEQLGLQLRVTSIPVESLVIDSAALPTDN